MRSLLCGMSWLGFAHCRGGISVCRVYVASFLIKCWRCGRSPSWAVRWSCFFKLRGSILSCWALKCKIGLSTLSSQTAPRVNGPGTWRSPGRIFCFTFLGPTVVLACPRARLSHRRSRYRRVMRIPISFSSVRLITPWSRLPSPTPWGLHIKSLFPCPLLHHYGVRSLFAL